MKRRRTTSQHGPQSDVIGTAGSHHSWRHRLHWSSTSSFHKPQLDVDVRIRRSWPDVCRHHRYLRHGHAHRQSTLEQENELND